MSIYATTLNYGASPKVASPNTAIPVEYSPRFENPIQIFYKNFDGRSKLLQVRLRDTIREVRAMILRQEGITEPSSHFYLVSCGKVLADDNRLRDYPIQRDFTLYLLGRLV